jgi:O-antigen ligase
MASLFMMPIIPRGLRPIFIFVFLAAAVYSFVMETSKFKWVNFLINASIFIMYAISLIYTEDINYGFKKLGTGASLIIFPLAFSFLADKHIKYLLEKRFQFMWLFIIATAILCVGALVRFNMDYNFQDSLVHYVNILRSDIYGWNIHPIYLSMHIGISVIFSMFLLHRGEGWKKTSVLLIMNLVLIAFLLLMVKKGPIIALILICSFLVLVFKSKKIYTVFGVLMVVMIGAISSSPKIQSRFSELLQVQNNQIDEANSTSIRYAIYQCAVKTVPEAGIFGYGIGDGKEELLKCYENNARMLAVNKYNSHNQYLGIILNIGYLGIGLLALFIFYHLLRAFKGKNYLLIAVLVFYSIVMFSENILERENGVLFFSLFINFFLMLDSGLLNKSETKLSSSTIVD